MQHATAVNCVSMI